MSAKIAIPRWIVCVAFGMCISFLYFVVTLLLSHREWYHKMGEGPALSQWIDALDMVLGDFPFGYWIRDGSLSYLLNGVLWSALAGGLCALHFHQRNSSNKSAAREQPPSPARFIVL
jgi:hypothetical protein